MAFAPMERIWIPAPVNSHEYVIKRRYLLIRYFLDLQIIENLSACSRDFAQILMSVCFRIDKRKLQRVVEKLLPQPLVRHCPIIGGMNHRIAVWMQYLFIHEIGLRFRRVKRHEIPVQGSTASGRLQYGTDLLHPGKLICFFKPSNAKITFRGLDRLDFHRIVKAPKENYLPGFQSLNLHWRNAASEFVI